MTHLTDDERARLRRLHEAATPGPWYPQKDDLIGGFCLMLVDQPPSTGARTVVHFASAKDSRFIAAARSAVPALLDEGDALRARVTHLEAVCYFCRVCSAAPGEECFCAGRGVFPPATEEGR